MSSSRVASRSAPIGACQPANAHRGDTPGGTVAYQNASPPVSAHAQNRGPWPISRRSRRAGRQRVAGGEPDVRVLAERARRLIAEELRAHRRQQAVGADEHVEPLARAVGEDHVDAVGAMFERAKPDPERHRHAGRERVDDIGAPHRDRRRTGRVAPRADRERRQQPAAGRAHVGGGDRRGLRQHALAHAELAECNDRIRPHQDGDALTRSVRGAFIDKNLVTEPTECECSRKAPNSTPDDGYAPCQHHADIEVLKQRCANKTALFVLRFPEVAENRVLRVRSRSQSSRSNTMFASRGA